MSQAPHIPHSAVRNSSRMETCHPLCHPQILTWLILLFIILSLNELIYFYFVAVTWRPNVSKMSGTEKKKFCFIIERGTFRAHPVGSLNLPSKKNWIDDNVILQLVQNWSMTVSNILMKTATWFHYTDTVCFSLMPFQFMWIWPKLLSELSFKMP